MESPRAETFLPHKNMLFSFALLKVRTSLSSESKGQIYSMGKET